MHNIENILAFSQLKGKKIIKYIKRFNIDRAIKEIIHIQQFQTEAKQILITTELKGFPIKMRSA